MTKTTKSKRSKFNQQLRAKLRKNRYIIVKHISTKMVFESKNAIATALKTQIKEKWGLMGFACIEKRLDVVHFSKEPVNLAIISVERDLVAMIRTTLPHVNFQTISVHGSIRKAKQVAITRLKLEMAKYPTSKDMIQDEMLNVLEVGSRAVVIKDEQKKARGFSKK